MFFIIKTTIPHRKHILVMQVDKGFSTIFLVRYLVKTFLTYVHLYCLQWNIYNYKLFTKEPNQKLFLIHVFFKSVLMYFTSK